MYKRDLQLFIFQSTLPYGSDPAHQQGFVPRYYFNPRSLTGATISVFSISLLITISIHAPLRERRHCIREICSYLYFNPRSLTGATLHISKALFPGTISIHAPLRERPASGSFIPTLNLFQSTLPCGSDRLTALDIHSEAHFNPRSLAGATCCNISVCWPLAHFNPRSLAGATHMYSERARHTGNFNPRFLAGATSAGSGGGDIAEFQSTLPYGSDHYAAYQDTALHHFNPRSLTGATRYLHSVHPGGYLISIHAPLRERLYF